MNRTWLRFSTVLITVGWISVIYLHADYTLSSPVRTKTVNLEIEANTSVGDIGGLLKKSGLIREKTFFRVYALLNRFYILKPGVYEIPANYTLRDILYKIKNSKQDLKIIEVPPGWSIVEIASRLTANGYDGKAFIKAIHERKPVYEFEKNIPKNANRKFWLEGYLDPGSYYFKANEKPEIILEEMVKRFGKKLDKVKIKSVNNMTVDQLITIASLIQREGDLPEELPIISGVIYNRLNSKTAYNQRLMLDATTVYFKMIRDGVKPKNVKPADNKITNPYNTYLNVGLTPGPISTITEESLTAAMNPTKHKYEYYVSAFDGTSRHLFAETFSEHKKNILESNKNLKRSKRS